MHPISQPKVVVFFDVQKGRIKLGRIKVELRSKELPKTCENFRQLCTGEFFKNNKPTGFKESLLY